MSAGIILALLTAILAATHDSFINASSKKGDEYITALAMSLFSFPIVFLMIFITGIPEVNKYFWLALAIKIPLMSMAGIFRAKAHKHSDQSLVVPILATTPVFVMIFAPFFLGQSIRPLGVLGVAILAAGIYVMGITKKKKGFWEPLKAIYKETGVRYMLLVALIWSVTTILDGVGVINAGGNKNDIFLSFRAGAYWLLWTQALSALVVGVIVMKRGKKISESFSLKTLVPIGLSNCFLGLVQMCAMGMLAAAYVNSIKRLSIILSVLIGHYYFKEKGLKERMAGAILMILGFIFIVFS